MGLIKKLLWFVGGKPADVIYENGEIRHQHTDKKWQDWKDRFQKSPNHDWRQHAATQWDKVKKQDN